MHNPLTGSLRRVPPFLSSDTVLNKIRSPTVESVITAASSSTFVAPLATIPDRLSACKKVADFGGEVVQEQELVDLLEQSKDFESDPNKRFICYDGFEPSGRMHLAQGILKALNVNRLTSAGGLFVFWVADWFALLNNKLGGDLEKIKKTGEYFIEVWKASGMDMSHVKFIYASDTINSDPTGYWLRVLNIARANTTTRIKRCSQIMGRQEGDDQPSAQIFYPCMQAADVFFLHADVCQLGLDQRKVNMLAREYVDKEEAKNDINIYPDGPQGKPRRKPVIISHGMMPGLLEGQEKMSKSDPDSAIFMEDTVEDVNRKIKKAFCPPGIVEGNPCVAYVKMLVFGKFNEFLVKRSEKNGGDILYKTIEEFEQGFIKGDLHPADLKANLSRIINEMIDPVRKHFQENPKAKKLLEEIRSFKVTK
jgi:tyrosyl-tRNA synthetase